MPANTVPRAAPSRALHSGRPIKPQLGMAAVPTKTAYFPGVSWCSQLLTRHSAVVTTNNSSNKTNRMPACVSSSGSPSTAAPASMVQGSRSFMIKSDKNLLSRSLMMPLRAPTYPNSTSRKITVI